MEWECIAREGLKSFKSVAGFVLFRSHIYHTEVTDKHGPNLYPIPSICQLQWGSLRGVCGFLLRIFQNALLGGQRAWSGYTISTSRPRRMRVVEGLITKLGRPKPLTGKDTVVWFEVV